MSQEGWRAGRGSVPKVFISSVSDFPTALEGWFFMKDLNWFE